MTEGQRSTARGGDSVLAAAQRLANNSRRVQKGKKIKKEVKSIGYVHIIDLVVKKHHVAAPAPHEQYRLGEPYIQNKKVFGACGIEISQCQHLGKDRRLPCIDGECPGEN